MSWSCISMRSLRQATAIHSASPRPEVNACFMSRNFATNLLMRTISLNRAATDPAGVNSTTAQLFCSQNGLDKGLLLLREELSDGAYIPPRDYRYFAITDPKKREISVADFRDRVVHHALVNVLEPIYEKRFINDSYATRKGKGAHRAIEKAQKFLKNNRWYLKMDVKNILIRLTMKSLAVL